MSNELLQESQELLDMNKDDVDTSTKQELMSIFNLIGDNIAKIKEHGVSLTNIVRSMDKLLKNKSELFIERDINKFVETQVAKFKHELDAGYQNIPLEYISADNSKKMCANIMPAELSLVLNNLLNNSIYALYEKSLKSPQFSPRLTIETQHSDNYAIIIIKDNGIGISVGEQKQLFSPFFTTKPTAKGSGLGLFLSQDIIKQHKGSISVDSQLNSYTTFTILLPLVEASSTVW